MKRITGIFLVSLLCFSGCGDSGGGTSAVTGEAVPVAPWGITDTTTPTYEWTQVPGATRYQLLVEDTILAAKIEEWYTAEQGECASGDGLCSVTPDVTVMGATWKVLACAGEECGLWSDELQFSFVVYDPTPPRFTNNGDDTVTDNTTRLMWSKNANIYERDIWRDAVTNCERLTLAGHQDWRLPSIQELRSLVVRQTSIYPYISLPVGHPFTNVQDGLYWSSTRHPADHEQYDVPMLWYGSFVRSPYTEWQKCQWCVRDDPFCIVNLQLFDYLVQG
ncbi:MAG: DUF1566 domain-containing protein [Deltaproteobacteria bacterium]|nr:DUF1566 domain-containing protein [Deltaproteobacteria bacterium]